MQTKGNINFVLVGARATGKTVYLASLFLNSKCVTAKDKKSINYLKPLADTLEKGNYPSATAGNLHEIQFNYKDKNFDSAIQIDDVDGHFIETLSEVDEHTQAERDRFIRNLELSEGIIFFFPYQEIFNEVAIKEFTYQIDTIVSKLKKMYFNRGSIPIPAVIAVSRWDDSPYFKSSDEEEKALEYINSKKFLRLAQEKIEVNFNTFKIVPLSSTGVDMNHLEPYNLEKPLEFFLKETYDNWIEKIESLNDDKEAQLIFLSKIHFDMRLYAKYDTLYHSLEKEYSTKLFKELEEIKTVSAYKAFEKKNIKIVNALLSSNQEKILEISKKLKTKKKLKWFSGMSLAVASVSIIVLSGLAWKAQSLLVKSEAELFSDIETEYKTNNYADALDDIEDYEDAYSDTLNIEHKNRVVEIKSIIQREQILTEARQIVNDDSFEDIERIEEVFTSFVGMGIDKPKLVKELSEKKNKLLSEEAYSEFKKSFEKKNFQESVTYVETNWKESYGTENYEIFQKILNKKFNGEVEKVLKSISHIRNIDKYNMLNKKLQRISSLKSNNMIKKINYTPTLTADNKMVRDEQVEIKNNYENMMKEGLKLKVSFGTDNEEENEPLGFKCDKEDEIILKINTGVYHFDNNLGCFDSKIRFGVSTQFFKEGRQTIHVIEEDLADNDHYKNRSFDIDKNDLIKLFNGEIMKKDIGSSYFVELGGK